ncbi:MAG: hypothetical protein AB8F78_19005 [Saprospiraceae bacterium]
MKLYWPNAEMPHGYICEHPIHLVYRLAGCLPVGALKGLTDDLVSQLVDLRKQHPPPVDRIEVLKEEYFNQYDALLDAQDQSRYILVDPQALSIVLDSWKMLHTSGACRVHVVCVMGNHVHVFLSAWPGIAPAKIGLLVSRHKTFTNKQLKVAGFVKPEDESSLWANGFFDRYIRPGTYGIVFKYVLDNPLKAGCDLNGRIWPGVWVPKQ